ncbi:hypothetical protein KC352_g43901, partial [Hortaea werneckii]
LLSPTYVPPPQRTKRRTFYQQPLKNQFAWVKHWFKEGAKRAKSPTGNGATKQDKSSPQLEANGKPILDTDPRENLQRESNNAWKAKNQHHFLDGLRPLVCKSQAHQSLARHPKPPLLLPPLFRPPRPQINQQLRQQHPIHLQRRTPTHPLEG